MKIEIKILDKQFYKQHPLPSYQTSGSAALDLCCTKDITIYPQKRVMIPTGLAIWIGSWGKFPHDHSDRSRVAGVILPRSDSGAAGLVLANTVGLIDEDYQGELMVSAWNCLEHMINTDWGCGNTIKLKAGDRFAQLMFIPVIKAQWEIVEKFTNETRRGL